MKFQFRNILKNQGDIGQAQNGDASGSGSFGRRKLLESSRITEKYFRELLIYRDLKAWRSMAKAFGESADGRESVEKKYLPGNDKEGFRLYMEAHSRFRMVIDASIAAGCMGNVLENTERTAFNATAGPEQMKISIEDVKGILLIIAGNKYDRWITIHAEPDSAIELSYDDSRVWKFAKSIKFSTISQLHEEVLRIYAKTSRLAEIFRDELVRIKKGETLIASKPEKA